MRRLRVVGIGPGGPDQLTVEAVAALHDVDVFLVPDKGIPDLVALRSEILARHTDGRAPLVEVPDPPRDRAPADYEKAVADWHEARVETYERALLDHVADDGVAGMLVWGDPSLYDSTLRIVDRINARRVVPLVHDVVPGVSSVSLLAARHRIALHRVGEPVTITTGRRLPDAVTPAPTTWSWCSTAPSPAGDWPGPTGTSGGAPTSARRTRRWWPAGWATSWSTYEPRGSVRGPRAAG